MKGLSFERQGPKQTEKETPRKHNVGNRKRLQNSTIMSSELSERFCTHETRTECNTKRNIQRTRKKLLQLENVIEEIKIYIIGLEDKVLEITQQEEQKDWKEEITESLEKSYYVIKRSS